MASHGPISPPTDRGYVLSARYYEQMHSARSIGLRRPTGVEVRHTASLQRFLPALVLTYYAVVLGVTRAYSLKCVEGNSLLKNSLYARFGPRSGSKHTIFGAFWSFWSPIGSHFRLGADFFNRLGYSQKFGCKIPHKSPASASGCVPERLPSSLSWHHMSW